MKLRSKKGWKSVVPLRLTEKSARHFCFFSKVKSDNDDSKSTPVYLNVYDLTPMNGYVYWAGLGIFHSGVEGMFRSHVFVTCFYFPYLIWFLLVSEEFAMCLSFCLVAWNLFLNSDQLCSYLTVHGVEYAFGAHDYSSSGVFEVEPRQCPGFKFRKSILVGTTSLDAAHVREFMERQAANYNGDTYHLIVKNCNHFCKDICYKLTGKRIPKWVNRLAKLGKYFAHWRKLYSFIK